MIRGPANVSTSPYAIRTMSRVTITWKKSTIGYPKDQRRTIAGLGLRRLHQTVEHEDTPAIRGMIFKVRHLVEVEELT